MNYIQNWISVIAIVLGLITIAPSTMSFDDNGYNAKYMDVRNFVLIEQKASTTLIQRKFKIGYGKAANYMDMLEDEGIVGPENGSKGREVLMTFEEWEAKNESENN